MNYHILMDMATELGYRLAISGAETFRIEESINRIMQAYDISAEAFAIPNCLHVSIETDTGEPMTRMRRIGYHGNDLDAIEKYNSLSRRICAEKPDPTVAMDWIKETDRSLRSYTLPVHLLGNFLGALGFCIIFGGSFADCLCAGICGLAVGFINKLLDYLKVNLFFRTIASSFFMAFVAYVFGYLQLAHNVDTVIIGTLMILVPGLIFTNAMRDIIYGDTNSGINRIVQVFLIAGAIALGTGAAWSITCEFMDIPATVPVLHHNLYTEIIACFIGCIGFSILFNIHGFGTSFCAIGGVLTWVAYRLVQHLSHDDITAYFFATATAALYSEIMARIRKYPAISYLLISIFPLIPGAGVYYTMNYAVKGNMTSFASQGRHTIAIACVMAVGILLISTIVRAINDRIHKLNK